MNSELKKYELLLRKLRQVVFNHPNPTKCIATLLKVKDRVILLRNKHCYRQSKYAETMWM